MTQGRSLGSGKRDGFALQTEAERGAAAKKGSLVPSVLIWLVAAGHFLFAGVGALFEYYIEPQTPGSGWPLYVILVVNGLLLILAGFHARAEPLPWRRATIVSSCWGGTAAVSLFLLMLAVDKVSIPNAMRAVGIPFALFYIVSGLVHRSWRVLALTFVITLGVYSAAMIGWGIIVTIWSIVTETPLG